MLNESNTFGNIALRLSEAFNERDAARLASLYEENAVLMPPNQPAVHGRDAIHGWFEGVLTRVSDVQITPIASHACGELGFQVGISLSRTKVLSLKETHHPVSLKFILILKRTNGEWKILYDIWNLDQPP